MTEETSSRKSKVLIVEDSVDILAFETMLFEKEGADVVGLSDPTSAMNAVQESLANGHPFDLIVVDIRMPLINGYEFAQQIRTAGFSGTIAAVTANATMEGKATGATSGIDLYFSKAVFKNDLVRALLEQVASGMSAR